MFSLPTVGSGFPAANSIGVLAYHLRQSHFSPIPPPLWQVSSPVNRPSSYSRAQHHGFTDVPGRVNCMHIYIQLSPVMQLCGEMTQL
ncbi:hypothetical protein R84981_002030 [Carnimonas sp. R-84981]